MLPLIFFGKSASLSTAGRFTTHEEVLEASLSIATRCCTAGNLMSGCYAPLSSCEARLYTLRLLLSGGCTQRVHRRGFTALADEQPSMWWLRPTRYQRNGLRALRGLAVLDMLARRAAGGNGCFLTSST